MLFELNKEQSLLTSSLAEIIQNKIGNSYISFSQYMDLALYHPQYGYYNNCLYKFGSNGDYITSPLVSELFGSSLSVQIWEAFEKGAEHNILEFGAGNGQLMLDILTNLGSKVKHYYIIELSASLALQQQQRLIKNMPDFKDRVTWLTQLPQEFNGVIIGNEILDAIPCDVVYWNNAEIFSKVVTHKDGKFLFTEIKASRQIQEIVKDIYQIENDYISEVSPRRIGFINTISGILNQGVILLIDYGYGQAEYYSPGRPHGTLRGFFRQHQLDDVLIYPGLIDITSSVDFTSIANAAISSSLDLLGFTTQSSFLINCGIVDQLERKRTLVSDSEYLQFTNQLNRLISPNDMGDIFKVIAFSKQLDHSDYIGFRVGDRTYTL